MRGLTLVEMAGLVALGGASLAATAPVFLRNLHASRLVEALEGLEQLGLRATALAAARPIERAYPAPAPLTPANVPRGAAVSDPEGTWQHPTWVRLGFETKNPHWFSFAFDSTSDGSVARFTARAHGDLDGDGLVSTLELSGQSRSGEEPMLFPVEIHREIE